MAEQAKLFDSPQHGFESFGWRLQIKKPFFTTKPASI